MVLAAVAGLGSYFVLCAFFLYQFGGIRRNSDEAGSLLAGYEMFHGNFLLSAWTLPPDSYWLLEDLAYGVMTVIAGVRPSLLYILPAAIWALVVMLVIRLVRTGAQPAGLGRELVPVILLVFPPLVYGDALHFIGDAPGHMLTIACSLSAIALIERYLARAARRSILLIPYCLICTVAASSDPFSLVVLFIPACLTLLFKITEREWRRPVKLLACTACSWFAGYYLTDQVVAGRGFSVVSQDNRLCDLQDLPVHLFMAVRDVMTLFGTNFSSKPFAGLAGAVPAIARLPLLMLGIGIVWHEARRMWRFALTGGEIKPPVDLIDLFSVSVILVTISSVVLSRYLLDETSIRYFVPVLVFSAIVLGRRQASGRRWRILLLFQLSLAACVALILPVGRLGDPAGQDEPSNVAKFLRQHRLDDGYAGYWDASVVTVFSHGTIHVRPAVRGGRCGLQPYLWLSSRRWYQDADRAGRHKTFVIVRTSSNTFLNQNDVLEHYGTPERIYPLGTLLIDVYSPGVLSRSCPGTSG